jgi:hypothetical protein
MCERAAGNALKRLRDTGMLARQRRCLSSWRDGRHVLEQLTNAYFLRPVAEWLGFRPPPEPPLPQRGTWGDHPREPSVRDQAAAETDPRSKIRALRLDPDDPVSAALARLGAAIAGGEAAKA